MHTLNSDPAKSDARIVHIVKLVTNPVRSAAHTSPRRLVLLLIVAMISLVGVGVGVAQATSDPPPPPAHAPGVPNGNAYQPDKGPFGLPAIHPRAALAHNAGPHFLEADVRQYFSTKRPAYAVPGTANPVVTRVQFLSIRNAYAQLRWGASDYPGDTPVCLVHLTGTFQSDSGPVPGGGIVYHDGDLIFDATTGNLLVSTVG